MLHETGADGMNIKVNFDKVTGRIKPLHGIGNAL